MASETLTHLGLIAQLRWRLFCNSLRTSRAKLELAGQVFLSVIAVLVGGGLGLVFFAASYFLAGSPRYAILHGLLWGVFLAWLFLPMLVAAATTHVDFRELLRYPLRFSAYLLLSVAYSLFDPIALVALFWLACIFAGIVSARPDLALHIAPAFLALAAVTLLLSRALMTAIERLFRRRRGRETFFMVFVLTMLSVQVFVAAAEDYAEASVKFIGANPELLLVFPPSLAFTALEGAVTGNSALSMSVAAVLALYAGILFAHFRRRALAQYRGEYHSPETAGTSAQAAPVEAGWHVPAVPGTIAALLEKEARYALRNGFTLMNLAIPLFLPAIFGAVMAGGEGKLPEVLTRDPGGMFLGLVAYAQMVTMQLIANQFAFEGFGFQFLLCAPVRFQQVVAAKNLAYAVAMVLDAALIWLVLALFGQAPGVTTTLVVLSALPFLLLAQIAAGNLLSLYFPRRFDFGKFKQRQSGLSVLFSILQQVVTLAIAGGIYALAGWLDVMWVAALAYLVLGAAMWQVYRISLAHYEDIVSARRETLTAELCHD